VRVERRGEQRVPPSGVVLHDGDGIADQRFVAIAFDIDTIFLESWR
jgi:hypothetical protein